MIKTNPYLNFNGNCEEAFNFYRSVFGGEFLGINRYSERDEFSSSGMSVEDGNKILHVALAVGEDMLMGSDVLADQGPVIFGTHLYISLHPDTLEEGRKVFDALSEGGKIEMPLAKQFWGDHCGSFIDKFGVGWMMNISENHESN